jgi:hypothetical protein
MARFKSTTFGQISGKHGEAVAAVRKDGLCILKVYRVASNPNTVGQKTQRGKFGFVMKELNCLRKVFSFTYASQYGINKAVSQAMKSAISGESSSFVLDFSKVLIAPNTFQNAIATNLMLPSPNKITIEWSAEFCSENQKQAMLNIVALQPETKQVNLYENIARFNAQMLEIELPNIWESQSIHLWCYLSPHNSGAIQGQYLGFVENTSRPKT